MKNIRYYFYIFIICCLTVLATGCGFHLQGEKQLPPPLHHLYFQAPDRYGQLARTLQDYLKMSHVELVASPVEGTPILNILRDDAAEQFLSVSSTQQTRQYQLTVTVVFNITDTKGRILLAPQTLVEARPITIQANQILGSSNEANLFYQQMRRTLAYSIMNRLASNQVAQAIQNALLAQSPEKLP